ncbi:uncharacterized protein RNJ42_00504 [Nakaseomyces bracarensis]|uniref:uncharacterized protein n=1 Tax=Nakaseomyces bracarensis TaxID=273131 RepID=UPI003871426E
MTAKEPKTVAIMVPCHAIWKGTSDPNIGSFGQSPDNWFLAPFQYEGRDHLSFIKHALTGVSLLLDDIKNSTLIFSGSQTKEEAGPVSEAESYQKLVERILGMAVKDFSLFEEAYKDVDQQIIELVQLILNKLNVIGITLKELFEDPNITLEEYALDSFDNLLYSLGQFYKINGVYPYRMVIVGFGFKKARYINLHARAIDYRNINYVSIEPSPENYSETKLNEYFDTLSTLENKNAYALFLNDFYGHRSPLADKKQQRNPYKKSPDYEVLNLLKNLNDYDDDEKFRKEQIMGNTPW